MPLNLDDQIVADKEILAETHALEVSSPEDWTEEIEAVEMVAYTNRVLAQNGYPVQHNYGELNWLAEALGLPLDQATGGNNVA
jgi:hypothetical protein